MITIFWHKKLAKKLYFENPMSATLAPWAKLIIQDGVQDGRQI